MYAGRETKIQMNAADPPMKSSSLKAYVDRETLNVLCLQVRPDVPRRFLSELIVSSGFTSNGVGRKQFNFIALSMCGIFAQILNVHGEKRIDFLSVSQW